MSFYLERTHKARKVVLERANEIKLVYPQPDVMPAQFADFPADHRWLSPMDGRNIAANTQAAFDYCLAHPQWRMNIQAHKYWGIA